MVPPFAQCGNGKGYSTLGGQLQPNLMTSLSHSALLSVKKLPRLQRDRRNLPHALEPASRPTDPAPASVSIVGNPSPSPSFQSNTACCQDSLMRCCHRYSHLRM